jgi:hypothetical protein
MIPIAWSKVAEKTLRPALGNDKNLVRQEVKTGRARLFIHNELFIVARHEPAAMVYVAVAGRGLKRAIPAMVNYAVGNGYSKVRFHTKRPGKLLPKLNNLSVELVERKRNLLSRDEFIYKVNLI